MKKWIARLTAVLTAGMCLCTGLSLPASATDAATLQQYETEVLIQVNRERAAYGLDPLYTAASIQLAAEKRAVECITSFSHTRPDGTISLQDALRILTYYSYASAGKTVSWNSIS